MVLEHPIFAHPKMKWARKAPRQLRCSLIFLRLKTKEIHALEFQVKCVVDVMVEKSNMFNFMMVMMVSLVLNTDAERTNMFESVGAS